MDPPTGGLSGNLAQREILPLSTTQSVGRGLLVFCELYFGFLVLLAIVLPAAYAATSARHALGKRRRLTREGRS